MRHAYRLTARGADLGGAVRMLAGWGARAHAGRSGRDENVPVHDTCGSPLDTRWFCGTCDSVIADPAPDEGAPGDDDLIWV